MGIREFVKDAMAAGAAEEKKQEEAIRPCVECGAETAPTDACGLCFRERAALVSLCAYSTRRTCSEGHSRKAHAQGQVGEHDPAFPGGASVTQ